MYMCGKIVDRFYSILQIINKKLMFTSSYSGAHIQMHYLLFSVQVQTASDPDYSSHLNYLGT